MSSIEFYSVGIVHASACAEATLSAEQVALVANVEFPTGISTRWSVTDTEFATGEPNPCPCNDHPEARKHWLLTC